MAVDPDKLAKEYAYGYSEPAKAYIDFLAGWNAALDAAADRIEALAVHFLPLNASAYHAIDREAQAIRALKSPSPTPPPP